MPPFPRRLTPFRMIRPLILPLLKISGKARRTRSRTRPADPFGHPRAPRRCRISRTGQRGRPARPVPPDRLRLYGRQRRLHPIHEKYGDVGFGKAMDFLFNALGNDLATDVPSMETTPSRKRPRHPRTGASPAKHACPVRTPAPALAGCPRGPVRACSDGVARRFG